MTMEHIESFQEKCALWRFRCPVEVVEGLQFEGSKYSSEFEVGRIVWRLHLQHRAAPQTNEVFLAVHLQCCSPSGAYGHFKITVCNRDAAAAKSKTFHCHFKKSGSAWGLHHFISLERLLKPEAGFVDSESRCVIIDVTVNVLDPGADGSYSLGALPSSSKTYSTPYVVEPTPSRRALPQASTIPTDPLSTSHVKAPLVYPFEHLELLCDMWFDVSGVKVKAHRCVVAARILPLIPKSVLPLVEGCTVTFAEGSMEVFTSLLRYAYTEDYPEPGVLRPESLLDLYMLAAKCEFFDLCGLCLRFVRPLLSPENVLPIVLTRYNASDDVLTAMYLRVLLDNYDALIQERQFEDIPGHLFRKLSLILRDKERLPAVNIPPTRNTLGRQLAALAESGQYSDYEIKLADGAYVPAHRYLLASRSVLFSHCFSPLGTTTPEPAFDQPEFRFSFRAWQKFLLSLYRRSLGESPKDLSPEDIAMAFKMHSVLTLDGQLKREAEQNLTAHNALRVLVFAVKHGIVELRDRASAHISSNFPAMIRHDPQAWDLISDLSQPAVVSLFRAVTETFH